MGHYDAIAKLPIEVERYSLEPFEMAVSSGFDRLTTVFVLAGGGEAGRGEDVTYEQLDQLALQQAGNAMPLEFKGTFGEFSDHVGGIDTFPEPPSREDYRNYRRWGIESAALDLALRQSGTSLGELLGIEPRPVRFILSVRLGEPPSMHRIEGWSEVSPGLEFKLDAENSWSREFIEQVAGGGRVRQVDLKGLYSGTVVDNPPTARLYSDVVELFPDAWIEDPGLTDETRPVIEPVWDRITWDAAIHSLADVKALEHEPKCLNIKPSRSGSVRELLAIVDHCQSHGIEMYSGGQFELDVGRGHLHVLASLFFPDAPNDAAPVEYHVPEPVAGVPVSPLTPPAGMRGFRWE